MNKQFKEFTDKCAQTSEELHKNKNLILNYRKYNTNSRNVANKLKISRINWKTLKKFNLNKN